MDILITGSGSGLGAQILFALTTAGHHCHPFDLPLNDVRCPMQDRLPAALDVLINCAGINYINWLPNVREVEWDAVMDTNCKGIFNMTQALLPQLKASKGTVLNIVSNAASVPMRCSAAYNASKGAALILTKQLARELSLDGITVFSISPNKLRDTGMSKSIDEQVMQTRQWTREQAQAYQRQSLLTGEETPPRLVADFVAFLLSSKERHKYLTGTDIPYGA